MSSRIVMHPEAMARVDERIDQKVDELTDDVAGDMRKLVPKDTRKLEEGIRVVERGVIVTTRPGGGGGVGPTQPEYAEEVPYFVEFGTEDTRAQPYIRPAAFVYRT